jgi:hypothetical protein
MVPGLADCTLTRRGSSPVSFLSRTARCDAALASSVILLGRCAPVLHRGAEQGLGLSVATTGSRYANVMSDCCDTRFCGRVGLQGGRRKPLGPIQPLAGTIASVVSSAPRESIAQKDLGSVHIAVSAHEEIDRPALSAARLQVTQLPLTFIYVSPLLQDPPTGRAYRLQRFSKSGR